MAFSPMWPLSATVLPAVVLDLEADFLRQARAGLANTPYLSEGGRSEMGGCLARNASARTVGERLLRLFVENKLSLAEARFGNGEVQVSRFPASRYFEPLQERHVPRAHRPSLPGDLLEVSLGETALRNGGFYVIDEFSSFLGGALLTFGWFVNNALPSPVSKQARTVFRVGSVDALETGLHYFLGSRAARFCFVPGVISPGDMNELHRHGWHGVGLPMGDAEAHNQIYEPAELALHDAWHGAHWSVNVLPWTRQAAVRLYAVLQETGSPKDLRKIQGVMDLQLIDLLLEVRGLGGVIDDLKRDLPCGVFLKVMWRWNLSAIPALRPLGMFGGAR